MMGGFVKLISGLLGLGGRAAELRKATPMELAGKVCQVTTGTNGIGAMTALSFAARGAHVAAAVRNRRSDSLEMLPGG